MMRAPGYVTWSVALLSLTVPALARAQDPDSLPAVEVPDSLDDDQDQSWDDADTSEVHHPVERHRGGKNPYLREVESEHRSARRGPFWIAGSLGLGDEAVAAPGGLDPYSQARTAPTLSVGFGGTVGQSLRLGLEGFVWFRPNDDVVESVGAGLLTGKVYPFQSLGLFLKSGFGIGRYAVSEIGCDCQALVSDYGFAWTVGAGIEAPVGRGLWLGPTVEMLRMNVTGPDGYRERVINFGISITYDGKD